MCIYFVWLRPALVSATKLAHGAKCLQAKWINMYHQLRRFKAVHGHTHVPEDYRNSDEPGWEILAKWVVGGACHSTYATWFFLMFMCE